MNEIEKIKQRYEKRKDIPETSLYNPLNSAVYMGVQERKRAIINLIKQAHLTPVNDKKVLEIGCGSGSNLNELISLGFLPENLIGNELLEERANTARYLLPEACGIMLGDASAIDLSDESFDVVYQSTVFTSILDNDFQQKLAEKMWQLVKPGGGILWYDFIYNNPKNSDVKGVSVKRIRQLFPKAEINVWSVTLMPPVSRLVTKINPELYNLFNVTPLLRSHVLCWIKKRS